MTDHQIEIDDLHEALAEKDAQIADLRKQLDWYRNDAKQQAAPDMYEALRQTRLCIERGRTLICDLCKDGITIALAKAEARS